MRRWDVYDWIFWICEGLLGLWILAKLLGFIQTPLLIELLPFLTLGFMAGNFYRKIITKLEHVEHELASLRQDISHHDQRIHALELNKTG